MKKITFAQTIAILSNTKILVVTYKLIDGIIIRKNSYILDIEKD